MTPGLLALQRRVREIRSRAAIRAWDFRQRHYARGVWLRLRRLLVDASETYVLGEDEARLLLADGLQPDPVGLELEPPKSIFVVERARLEKLAGKRAIATSLGPELLEARILALVPWAKPAGG
jgi:hypothetical protein